MGVAAEGKCSDLASTVIYRYRSFSVFPDKDDLSVCMRRTRGAANVDDQASGPPPGVRV